MKNTFIGTLSVLFLQNCSTAQDENAALKLEKTIALPRVSGRIDHMAYDSAKKIVYVAALGNNTVETVDLKSGKVIRTLKDLDEPQGVVFIPGTNDLFIANGGNGSCDVFNTENFQKISSVQLGDDADNVRYDPGTKRIYVGYANGGIAIVDAVTFKITSQVKLSGHPESFQLDRSSNKLYVNVPDAHLIEVVDLVKNNVTARWKVEEARSNYPMALDEAGHRLFIGCRHPAKLLVLDAQTGKTISSLGIDDDVDDIFYNSVSKEIYLSCGAGFIDVVKQSSSGVCSIGGKVITHSGARTSFFLPGDNRLLVAAPASIGKEAQLLIYSIKK